MNVRQLLTLIVLLQLFSCKKGDVSLPVADRLSKIEFFDPANQTATTLFKYDDAGNLTEISSSGPSGTELRLMKYDGSARLQSNTISTSRDGNLYKFDFVLDGDGRVIQAKGTSFIPNVAQVDSKFSYDSKNRITIDSIFTKAGLLHSYINFEYDDNDNVIAYQQFVNQSTSLYSQGRITIEYDRKQSPYTHIGQLLYTSGGGGTNYFYLAKNNPIKANLNSSVSTPGGKFNYRYYSNSLLKSSTLNVRDAVTMTFYYTK